MILVIIIVLRDERNLLSPGRFLFFLGDNRFSLMYMHNQVSDQQLTSCMCMTQNCRMVWSDWMKEGVITQSKTSSYLKQVYPKSD